MKKEREITFQHGMSDRENVSGAIHRVRSIRIGKESNLKSGVAAREIFITTDYGTITIDVFGESASIKPRYSKHKFPSINRAKGE